MTQALENRYRRLLRSYPRSYRQERSTEILGTLMDLARPGQQRPTTREVAALILAGLRTRAGIRKPHTTGAVWAGALRWAALLMLAYGAATMLATLASVERHLIASGHLSAPIHLDYLLTAGLIIGALLATAAGRAWALPLTLVATIAQHWAPDWAGYHQVLWQLPIAAVMMVPLLRWRVPRSPHPARWLLGIPVALIVMPTQLLVVLPFSVSRIVWSSQEGILLALLLGCVLWSIVDARPAIAAGVLLLHWAVEAILVYTTTSGLTNDYGWLLIWCGAPLVPLVAGATRATRLARL